MTAGDRCLALSELEFRRVLFRSSWVPCVSCLLPWVSLRSTVLTCWLGWPPFGLFASMFTTTIMY